MMISIVDYDLNTLNTWVLIMMLMLVAMVMSSINIKVNYDVKD